MQLAKFQAPDGYLINTQAQVLVLNEQSAYQGQLVFADEVEPREPERTKRTEEPK